MTTNPVVTVTDELLEELEQLAENANIARSGNEWFSSADCTWWTGNVDEGDFMAGVSPATIFTLTHHIRTMQQELKAAHISVDNCELFRKDADRYQALRLMNWYDSPLAVVKNPSANVRLGTECPSRSSLDHYIDTFMAASHSS